VVCIELLRETGVAIALCRFLFVSGGQCLADLIGEVAYHLQFRFSFHAHGL